MGIDIQDLNFSVNLGTIKFLIYVLNVLENVAKCWERILLCNIFHLQDISTFTVKYIWHIIILFLISLSKAKEAFLY